MAQASNQEIKSKQKSLKKIPITDAKNQRSLK
jgi:hypothetical protein